MKGPGAYCAPVDMVFKKKHFLYSLSILTPQNWAFLRTQPLRNTGSFTLLLEVSMILRVQCFVDATNMGESLHF